MIFGIGTDIVRVARLEKSLARFGERFTRRILTDAEYADFRETAHPVHFLAKRFAAKEATAKAMGTGFRNGLSLRHIGVVHDAIGKPQLQFSGVAADFLQHNSINSVHISLADEKDYAIAFVTLSTD